MEPKEPEVSMQAGVRVIRGPDWRYKKQDAGEGHAGRCIAEAHHVLA